MLKKRSWLAKVFVRRDTVAFLLCICFFVVWPDFDLTVSKLLYSKNSGGFIGTGYDVIAQIYSLTTVMAVTIGIALIVLVILSYMSRNSFLRQRRVAMVFLLSAFILGPGLVVNTVFKGNWERPRPLQITEYGGSQSYEAPFSPRFECEKCRSFVSGHASIGFFLFAFTLLSTNRKWLLLPVLAGSIIGVVRMSQGGHFLSDVVFSGWVVWFTSLMLYSLMVERAVLLPHRMFRRQRQSAVVESARDGVTG